MRTLLTVICILFTINCFAQRPGNNNPPLQKPISTPGTVTQRILSEDCDNGVDDNGDGLIDCEDYSCYFQKPNTTCNCVPSNTLWTVNGTGQLLWANTQTGAERVIGATGTALTDVAWTSDGVLYGVDFNANIYQVNPVTAQLSLKFSMPGYFDVNAMTSDQEGNFYLAGGQKVFRYNKTTGKVTPVADLTGVGGYSGDDLAFANGPLYLACSDNKIAKIDVSTGNVQLHSILGLPWGAQVYGIVSAADGSLYLSGEKDIYRLNPATMQAVFYYKYKSSIGPIWGLANYNDNCNAPEPNCQAEVAIAIETAEPYCIQTGVSLTATGKGVTGNGTYQWLYPDGSTAATPSIKVMRSGWYKVIFSGQDFSCKASDSVLLNILKTPYVDLGADTVLCVGSQFVAQNKIADASLQYQWQDGTATPQYTIKHQGKYWLTATNACGSVTDTILVQEKNRPVVELGAGREICAYDTIQLFNQLHQPEFQYLWSNGETNPLIVVNQPGWFKVAVSNECGVVQDSIFIQEKTTGCECFLYVPTAFTPNGDGKNDVLKVHATCGITGEFAIYNRWGNIVFTTKDLSKGWSGHYNGKLQPGEVYVFVVNYQFLNRPDKHRRKGTFLLVK